MVRSSGKGSGGQAPLPIMSTACVLWTGRLTENAYGRVSLPGGQQVYAHRLACEQEHGPIPDGLTVDHLCWITACVNVEHMELVTLAENIRRAAARITHCPSRHPYDAENTRFYVIRKTGNVGRKCRACHRIAERARKAAA